MLPVAQFVAIPVLHCLCRRGDLRQPRRASRTNGLLDPDRGYRVGAKLQAGHMDAGASRHRQLSRWYRVLATRCWYRLARRGDNHPRRRAIHLHCDHAHEQSALGARARPYFT